MFNYVDDFMGLEMYYRIQQSYDTLGRLLRDLGVSEADDKAVPPTTQLEFLGTWFDLTSMTIGVTQKRKEEILAELKSWRQKITTTRNQLERLLGKLQFISNCVRPGRVLVFRLRENLRKMVNGQRYELTQEMIRDISWWQRFLPIYDRVSILWMTQYPVADSLVASDACLTAMGAICGHHYTRAKFPQHILDNKHFNIAHLELIAVIATLRTWTGKLHGTRFLMLCDNLAVVQVVNTGYTKNEHLAQLMRELTFTCATNDMEIVLEHVKSEENRVPDYLSRYHTSKVYQQLFNDLKQPHWEYVELSDNAFKFYDSW